MLAVSEQPVVTIAPRVLQPSRRPLDEERRAGERLKRQLRVTLRPLGFSVSISGHANDVSEGGMYLVVNSPQGLCVGQRCELELCHDCGTPLDCVNGDCYATVVRTEPVTHGEAQFVGAGLRFDQPIFFSF